MTRPCSRRRFLGLAATAPLAPRRARRRRSQLVARRRLADAHARPAAGPAAVAITRARAYGSEAAAAMRQAVDLLGGLGSLVRGKTVTVKVNFTGWPIQSLFGRSARRDVRHPRRHGARARADPLRERRTPDPLRRVARASRCRSSRSWRRRAGTCRALQAIAGVEFENTRNLGYGSRYAPLAVPDGGRLFSYLRGQPLVRGHRRLRLAVQDEGARDRRRDHALDEEPVRHHPELALRLGGRGRGQAGLPRARSTGRPRAGSHLLPGEKPGFRERDRRGARAAHDRGREPRPAGAPRDRGRHHARSAAARAGGTPASRRSTPA